MDIYLKILLSSMIITINAYILAQRDVWFLESKLEAINMVRKLPREQKEQSELAQ